MSSSTDTVALPEIDAIQIRFDDLLRDDRTARELRTAILRRAFLHHVEHNPSYAAYAHRLGVGERRDVDLADIPLLPSALFKRATLTLRSTPEDAIVKQCVSSGTSGARSIVPRDEDTLVRFLGSVTASLPSLFGIDRTGEFRGIVLGPTTEEAGDLWFSYVISCLTLVMQTEHMVTGDDFRSAFAADRVRSALDEGCQVAIIGPPFRILELCERLEGRRTWGTFPERSFVISAGGWKDRKSNVIDAATFRQKVADAFGAKPSQIRDSYNMVELNSVVHECEFHHKHVPPWLEVQARDARTNRVLGDEREGVLGFLDASATSFPGFIMSEDLGVTRSGECACGRFGQRLQITRRVNRVEARGCALRMAASASGGPSHVRDRFFTSVYRGAPHGAPEGGRS